MMARMLCVCGLLLLAVSAIPAMARAAEEVQARKILALYSEAEEKHLWQSNIHRMAEMPLNHLGFTLDYYNIDQGFDGIEFGEDLHGILAWLPPGTRLKDPYAYISFLHRVADAGVRLVILGDLGFIQEQDGTKVPLETLNDLLDRFGVHIDDYWVGVTYDAVLSHIDRTLFPFERPFPQLLPPYQSMEAVREDAEVVLSAHHQRALHKDATLALISPTFSYISQGYTFYERTDQENNKIFYQWYVNPFRFFAKAFEADHLPKPDVTTYAGRRIFYSHIDGDGWNNISEVPEYRNKFALAGHVIYEKILKEHPEIPTSVAPIAAELDPLWVGRKDSQQVARDIFALPHVEATSHTYSHPFSWGFFADYTPDKEAPFLEHYKAGHWEQSFLDQLLARGGVDVENLQCSLPEAGHDHNHEDGYGMKGGVKSLPPRYRVPRAYGNSQFYLDLEVCGAADKISEYTPDGQAVRLMQWSGDTKPYAAVMAKLAAHDMLNINGGDTRFDPEYPSYIWVAPIGRQVGDYWQVYASNSNENTYTKDWSVRYYGFQYLPRTWANTDVPYRVKPANLYYHTFTGEKLSSLNALKKNIEHAKQLELHPMWASRYAAIAQGFYTAELVKLEKDVWKVNNRGALNTFRFDRASMKAVDYAKSQGVIGHRHHAGALYVFCDKFVKSPLIALQNSKELVKKRVTNRPYLYESSWDVWQVTQGESSLRFQTRGFGKGDMVWHVNNKKVRQVTAKTQDQQPLEGVEVTQKGPWVTIHLPMLHHQPITVSMEYQP
jgi:hypothetical protein